MEQTLSPPKQREKEEEKEEAEEAEGEEANGEAPEDQNPNQSQEWESMARAWVGAFPEGKAVTPAEVETWIDSNIGSLPSDLQSMPRSDLVDRLLAIQEYLRPPLQKPLGEANQGDREHARFQRTDRWLPVYSWLESLDMSEAVKSKDIADWLAENPEIGEQLCSRHSKYHLFHYIKKCHLKILKRRAKKMGVQQIDNPSSPKFEKGVLANELTPFPGHPLSNIPKDSDLYLAKRNEALQKYEILLALEKKLSPHFSKRPAVK